MSRELIDLPREVVSRKSLTRARVIGVDLGEDFGIVPYNTFVDDFDEYIDPKDVEIARLLSIIEALEKPKVSNTKRKHLTEAERFEVKELVEKGIEISAIATTYDISASTIYKWIKDNNWNFEGRQGSRK